MLSAIMGGGTTLGRFPKYSRPFWGPYINVYSIGGPSLIDGNRHLLAASVWDLGLVFVAIQGCCRDLTIPPIPTDIIIIIIMHRSTESPWTSGRLLPRVATVSLDGRPALSQYEQESLLTAQTQV